MSQSCLYFFDEAVFPIATCEAFHVDVLEVQTQWYICAPDVDTNLLTGYCDTHVLQGDQSGERSSSQRAKQSS